jgi:hypothetical protein
MKLALVFTFIFGLALSAEAEKVYLPENMPWTSAQIEVGRGFLPGTAETTVGGCAIGSTSYRCDRILTKPFVEPEFFVNEYGVKVVFRAISNRRGVYQMKADSMRKEAACGPQYVSRVERGIKITLAFQYHVNKENIETALKMLKERLTDVRMVFRINHDQVPWKSWNLSWQGGTGASAELLKKGSQCFWGGNDCEGYIDQAYADAAKLADAIPCFTSDPTDAINLTVTDNLTP